MALMLLVVPLVKIVQAPPSKCSRVPEFPAK
jgi:hypothetical protein